MIILSYWNIIIVKDLENIPNFNKYYEAKKNAETNELIYRIESSFNCWSKLM